MGEDGLGCLFYQFKKQQVLKKFREDNFKMLPYTESAQLDCVIVGADEVFSLENGVNFVMFGHGITSPRLVAYAPSAGQTDLARVEKFGCKELLASGFGKFTALSARDVGTQQLLHELTGKDAPIVCDPALLYPFHILLRRRRSTSLFIPTSPISRIRRGIVQSGHTQRKMDVRFGLLAFTTMVR